MTDKYILDGHKPVPCDDLYEWGNWMQNADRQVAVAEIGPLRVSTVFLGLDHGWLSPEPILFETMIFGDGSDSYQTRCATWDEAVRMHALAVDIAETRVAAAKRALGQ
jgi:hypothetical protein